MQLDIFFLKTSTDRTRKLPRKMHVVKSSDPFIAMNYSMFSFQLHDRNGAMCWNLHLSYLYLVSTSDKTTRKKIKILGRTALTAVMLFAVKREKGLK